MTSEERKTIVDLMHLESEAAEAEAVVLESSAQSLSQFADEADRYLTDSDVELATLDRALAAA